MIGHATYQKLPFVESNLRQYPPFPIYAGVAVPALPAPFVICSQDKIFICDLDRRLSGPAPLVSPPFQKLVVGDFDGYEIADVVESWEGVV